MPSTLCAGSITLPPLMTRSYFGPGAADTFEIRAPIRMPAVPYTKLRRFIAALPSCQPCVVGKAYNDTMMKMQERLQKILAHAGVASRRHAEAMITGGRVSVNGHIVTEL